MSDKMDGIPYFRHHRGSSFDPDNLPPSARRAWKRAGSPSLDDGPTIRIPEGTPVSGKYNEQPFNIEEEMERLRSLLKPPSP